MTTEPSYALTRPAYVSQSHLVVADLPLVSSFYQSMLGLNVIEKAPSGEVLGVGGVPLLTLTTAGNAQIAPRNAAGLFHTAFLVPDRTELARWLRHAAHNNVAARRRLRPSRQRGHLSFRPRRQRHRDLCRPAARRLEIPSGRPGRDGDAPPRSPGALQQRAGGRLERHGRRHGDRAHPSAGRRHSARRMPSIATFSASS